MDSYQVMSNPPTSVQSLPPFVSTSATRLYALYSDISRQKRSNPTSYHANVDWWRRALESLVRSGLQRTQDPTDTSGRLVLHAGRSLMDYLKIDGVGKPLGLGAVIDELRASNVLVPLSSFLSSAQSIYDSGWLPARIAAYVVGKPLWWTLEQLGIVGEDGVLTPKSRSHEEWWGDYVSVPLLEQAANAVIEKQYSTAASAADHLYTLATFSNHFGSVLGLNTLNHEDASVLLKFLERDRCTIVVEDEVIKFFDKPSSPEQRQVSAVDKGILELKTAILSMHTQIESLHTKMDEYTRKASEALRLRRKPMTVNYLRSRKQLDDLCNKRLNSLATLESTLLSVEAAANDIEIMKVYQSSSATLRAILAHPSLQRESIDCTMNALADANADAKEIDNIIRTDGEVVLNADQIDEEELEAELNQLIAEAVDQEAVEKVQEKLGKEKLRIPRTAPQDVDSSKISTVSPVAE